MAIPALTVKATIIFEQGANGWTESFWWQGLNTDLASQSDVLRQIVVKRRLLLGAESSIRAYKVSFETGSGGEQVLQDADLKYFGQAGYSQEHSDVADDALLMLWKDGTGQRNKFQFLRGIWDNIVTNGGAYTPGYGNWDTYLQQWKAQLLLPVAGVKGSSVGWLRQTPAVVTTITGYTVDDNGYVTMTVAPALTQGVLQPAFTGLPFGVPLETRVKGVNTKSTLNGQLLVRIIDATHVQTVKPVAVVPFRTSGTMTFYQRSLVLCGLDAITSTINIRAQKIVERKVGAPLLESRGRQKVRVRA